MRFPRKKYISNLENYLSYLLKGMSLEEWIDYIVNQLLDVSEQNKPPLKIDDARIFKERRIKKPISYKVNLYEKGRLVVTPDGFILEINPFKKASEQWYKVNLAHEIAHTFFYNINVKPPQKLISFKVGDQEIEWLCFQIAKSLLVPRSWLLNEINKMPLPGSERFSLLFLDKLAKSFAVPWQIIAQRLIEDLGLWNCIILLFYSEINDKQTIISTNDCEWRLKWQVIPQNNTEGLFIPIGHKQDGIWKYPCAKGNLSMFIKECLINEKSEFFSKTIDSKIIKSSTTGNLEKYLSNNLHRREYQIYCAIKHSLFNPLFESSSNRYRKTIFVMCFPF